MWSSKDPAGLVDVCVEETFGVLLVVCVVVGLGSVLFGVCGFLVLV